MITPPTPPSPGRPISASFFSRFIAWVKSCMLIDGVGYRIRRGPNGTSLVIDNVNQKSQEDRLWVFTYKETGSDEETDSDKDNVCWKNCRLQIGYDSSFTEKDCSGGLDHNEDGVYYAEVNLSDNTWEMKVNKNGKTRNDVPPHDLLHNKVNVFVSIVDDKKQTYSINCIPVAYKYV